MNSCVSYRDPPSYNSYHYPTTIEGKQNGQPNQKQQFLIELLWLLAQWTLLCPEDPQTNPVWSLFSNCSQSQFWGPSSWEANPWGARSFPLLRWCAVILGQNLTYNSFLFFSIEMLSNLCTICVSLILCFLICKKELIMKVKWEYENTHIYIYT